MSNLICRYFHTSAAKSFFLTLRIAAINSRITALDMERGVFYQRSIIHENPCTLAVEQRWIAHRKLRNLLLHEIEVNPSCNSEQDQWALSLSLNSGKYNAIVYFHSSPPFLF